MQIYSGPTRRVLRRFSGANGITIDGRVSQEEQRALYVAQTFTLQQRLLEAYAFTIMPPQSHFEEEDEFNVDVGDFMPFV